MKPIPPDYDRSVQRSRVRLHVLLTLSSLGEAYVGQISRLTGIHWTRVKWALLGHPPEFKVELSLVRLGLARETRTRGGRAFAITPAGKRKARSITSAWARRDRTMTRAGRKVQVTGHLPPEAASGDRSPVPRGPPPPSDGQQRGHGA